LEAEKRARRRHGLGLGGKCGLVGTEGKGSVKVAGGGSAVAQRGGGEGAQRGGRLRQPQLLSVRRVGDMRRTSHVAAGEPASSSVSRERRGGESGRGSASSVLDSVCTWPGACCSASDAASARRTASAVLCVLCLRVRQRRLRAGSQGTEEHAAGARRLLAAAQAARAVCWCERRELKGGGVASSCSCSGARMLRREVLARRAAATTGANQWQDAATLPSRARAPARAVVARGAQQQ